MLKLTHKFLIPPLVCLSGILSNPVTAQIIPDSTLGSENSQVTSDTIQGVESDRITGGAIRDSNLFHSFLEFNVEEGRGVYFENPAQIENILTRVTGSNISNIQGILGVLGNANLFLINPNGIIFGPNAQLDLQGSFLGTTADSVIFDNFEFSATNPQAPPLLTIDIPLGLRLRDNPGTINSNSVLLQVETGETLALIGGDVTLDGSVIVSPDSSIEIGGLSESGVISITRDLSFTYPEDILRSNILVNESEIDVGGTGIGEIKINTFDLEMFNSGLFTGINPEVEGTSTVPGNIEIDAQGDISVDGGFIANIVLGTGNSGDIEIVTNSMEVINGAQILTDTFGQGNTGSVIIEATGLVKLEASSIFSDINPGAVGNTGGIEISANSLEVNGGSVISATVFGTGDTGSVIIKTRDSVKFDTSGADPLSPSGVFSRVDTEAVGNSGGIEISAQTLEILNGIQISASTFGEGDAGSIRIQATDLVKLDGETRDGLNPTSVASIVNPDTIGNAGGVEIISDNIEITNGARISTSTFGNGDAGSVIIQATGLVKFDGQGGNDDNFFSSGASSQVNPGAVGNAGGIEIRAESVEVLNGAQINASTSGEGDAGNVNIEATGLVKLDGQSRDGEEASGAFSIVDPEGVGNAGGVEIRAESVEVLNGAQIDASTRSEGSPGSVIINATGLVKLDGEDRDGEAVSAVLSNVDTDAVGNAGGIEINADSVEVLNGAQISASTSGEGSAGSVIINATGLVKFAGTDRDNVASSGAFSQVNSTGRGNAGSVEINADSVEVIDGAQISATTFGNGDAGGVIINATESVKFDGTDRKGEGASGAFSRVDTNAIGNAGGIEINTGSLEVLNDAQIDADSRGEGNAGNITITANNFTATAQGSVQTNTNSTQNAGDIIFNIKDTLNLTEGSIESSTSPESTGDGGSIFIDPVEVNLTDNSSISVNSQGQGDGGNVTIIGDNLTVTNNSQVSAATDSGEGGNVDLDFTNLLELSNNSPITATAGGSGNGGNIEVQSEFVVNSNNSNITANAFEGIGGNIFISAQGIFIDNSSNITASSELGIDGVVETETPDLDPTQGLLDLPSTVVDPNRLIAQNPCTQGEESEFVITGKGGLAETPDQLLTQPLSESEWIEPVKGNLDTENNSTPNSENITSQTIKPAQGWIINEQGQVTLVDYIGDGLQKRQRPSNPYLCGQL